LFSCYTDKKHLEKNVWVVLILSFSVIAPWNEVALLTTFVSGNPTWFIFLQLVHIPYHIWAQNSAVQCCLLALTPPCSATFLAATARAAAPHIHSGFQLLDWPTPSSRSWHAQANMYHFAPAAFCCTRAALRALPLLNGKCACRVGWWNDSQEKWLKVWCRIVIAHQDGPCWHWWAVSILSSCLIN
jgi:hypothetical protein